MQHKDLSQVMHCTIVGYMKHLKKIAKEEKLP